jgi:spore maturation protein CgeB
MLFLTFNIGTIYSELKNDAERAEITKDAYKKVSEEHSFDVRVSQIIEMVKGK